MRARSFIFRCLSAGFPRHTIISRSSQHMLFGHATLSRASASRRRRHAGRSDGAVGFTSPGAGHDITIFIYFGAGDKIGDAA